MYFLAYYMKMVCNFDIFIEPLMISYKDPIYLFLIYDELWCAIFWLLCWVK